MLVLLLSLGFDGAFYFVFFRSQKDIRVSFPFFEINDTKTQRSKTLCKHPSLQ